MTKLGLRRLLLTASLLGVAGCATLEPRYARPAPPIPPAYPEGGAYPIVLVPAASGTQLSWPDFFVDARLRAVVRLALAQNRDLRTAAFDIVEARARYHVQRAELLPTVDATGSLVTEKSSSYGVSGAAAAAASEAGAAAGAGSASASASAIGIGGGGYYRIYSADLGFSSYELDLFGRVRSLTHEALETYLATAEARRAAQVSLVAEVATDYLTLAADTQRLATERQTLGVDEASLKVAEDRFTFGIDSQLDVRQAQTAVETSRANIATYTAQGAQDLNALDLVVGAVVPEALLPKGQGEALLTQTEVPAGLSSAVLLRRPDVLEAEHTLKADNADIGAARAAFFPTISLTAQGGSSSLSLHSLFGAGTGGYSFAPTVSLPIFDGGANRARLRLSRAQRDAAVAAYEKAIQTAFRDVADALAQRGTVDALIGAQTRLVEASDATLTLSRARYDTGSDTYLTVLTAELNLASARQALISGRLTRASNLVALYRALGGGADDPRM